MKTTKQIAVEDGVSTFIVLRWARNHNVNKFGSNYLWSKEDEEGFRNRRKKRGRPWGNEDE